MNVYDATMASAYPRGRRLRAADVAAWMAAAQPYLRGPVLDLGAGTGRFTAALAEVAAGPVIACEPSAAMRSAFPRAIAPLVAGAAEALPFAPASFAAVWASQILHHVRDLPAFAHGLRRVLRPAGHVLIRGGFDGPEAVPIHPYFPSAFHGGEPLLAETSGLLAAAGLPLRRRLEIDQVYAADADELIGKVAGRSLSNLALLNDDVFTAGLTRLTADARSGRIAFPIVERLQLLIFGPRS